MKKKMMIGALVGATLLFSVSAYAKEIGSMVDKVVDGEFAIKVNDVPLDTKAIVIEGTSYLPVRALGEAIGAEITFDADLGISVKAKETDAVTAAVYQLKAEQLAGEKAKLENDKQRMEEEIAKLKRERNNQDRLEAQKQKNDYEIEMMRNDLEYKKKRVAGLKDDIKTYTDQAVIDKIQTEISTLEKEIAELEAKLAQ